MNSSENNVYTKRMTADVWFRFQMQPNIEVIKVNYQYECGEKLMVATFRVVS